MHSRLDYKTLVTSIPTYILGALHLEQYYYRVLEASLLKFTRLIEIGAQSILDLLAAHNAAQLNNYVTLLTEIM